MQKFKKLFGSYEMTWKRLIIFAIATAVYTGVINLFGFLESTSFRDIAVYLEWWILFAVFIVSNCKNYKEAALKCFVFFLVSQPLIYLIQVPFDPEGFGIFRHYNYWFKVTLLTLPGAAVAYQIKRNDWISVLVLGCANAFLAHSSATYLKSCLATFPNHLLSCIFCILLALFLIFVFITDNKQKIVSIAIVVVVFFGSCFVNRVFAGPSTEIIELDKGNWTCLVDDESIVDVKLEDSKLSVTSKSNGTVCITLVDKDGKERVFYATVTGNEIFISELTD